MLDMILELSVIKFDRSYIKSSNNIMHISFIHIPTEYNPMLQILHSSLCQLITHFPTLYYSSTSTIYTHIHILTSSLYIKLHQIISISLYNPFKILNISSSISFPLKSTNPLILPIQLQNDHFRRSNIQINN